MAKTKYILYRILGNDLPPRHRKGQTLANLRTILGNEPDFPGLEKHWVLNKIIDPRTERSIAAMLEKHAQPYRIIPFDRLRFNNIPKKDYQKRLEVMIGLNQARNTALKEGKKRAQWVLVFDGNCFFTAKAWEKVAAACVRSRKQYIIVPMIRMVYPGKGIPSEPQIIFRHDSKNEFNERFGYGQDSKVELLRRLGVAGEWDAWDGLPQQPQKANSFVTAGYVWRLPSGNEAAERDIQQRRKCRDRAIKLLMDKIDQGL